MPKVLRIFNRFILGGPVLNAMILSKYLAPEFETRLITGIEDPGEQRADYLIKQYGIEPEFVNEMRRSVNPFQDLQSYQAIRKIIREYKPDIVHTHAAKAGAVGRMAAYHEKVPVIVHTFHGHTFHSYFNKYVSKAFVQIERRLARISTKIVTISDSQFEEITSEYRICPPSKAIVIPNGIDINKFVIDNIEKRSAWRKQFNIPEDATVVGIIGRMAPVKNHAMFVDVVDSVIRTADKPNLHFVIVGDGETRLETQNLLQAKHIPFNYFPENPQLQKVLFTSWQTDMDKVYSAMDVVCLTSLNEGTPISVIEAQATAKPVVSTRVGAVDATMIDGDSGYLVESRDAESFAARVRDLIQSPTQAEAMGKAGRDFVLEKYSHMRLVKDMRELYLELLAQKNK